jgi:multidrug efflux pump subunit AcrA (membrane-fusion protein)
MSKLKSFFKWIFSNSKRKIIFIIIVLILIFGIFILGKKSSTKMTYQTATVTKGTVVSTISASGKALSTSILPINTQTSGIVKSVYVKDGDKVYKGQKIADITLDTAGQQQYYQAYSSYLSAKSGVSSANSSYYTLQGASFAANQKFINDAVARELSTDDPTYIQEYGAWKAAENNFNNYSNQLQQANMSLANASINLQLSSPTITAPYAGTVSNINLVLGMVIANTSSNSNGTSTVSSQRVAVIKNDATPIVNVTVSETDVPQIKIGQKATIIFDSITDKTFTGVVATVDRIGTVTSNVTSYGINIKLDSGSDLILPNMAATADIIINTATDSLYIPSSSLMVQNGQTHAKTLVSGKEVDVLVETGISSDTETVITSGLNEGDVVITNTLSSTSSSSTTTGTSVFSSGLRGIGGGASRIQGR